MENYLSVSNGRQFEARLRIISGFSNGSLELLKRISKALFDKTLPEVRKSRKDVRRLAEFLVDPENEKAFVPPFVRANFAIEPEWFNLLQDQAYMRRVAQKNIQPMYAVQTGLSLEGEIRKIIIETGYGVGKGPVAILDDKEVDVAVPNTDQPRILIMSSYQLTTASSQTSKANEQVDKYQKIQIFNSARRQREKPDIQFINVLDGGGWLDRQRDLEVMYKNCDYCLTNACLYQLRDIAKFHMSQQ